jgi:hypothetical protein
MPDHAISYVESDLAPDMTLVEWRRSTAASPRARRRRLGLRTFVPAWRRPAIAA